MPAAKMMLGLDLSGDFQDAARRESGFPEIRTRGVGVSGLGME
jgi:hypothetical protein